MSRDVQRAVSLNSSLPRGGAGGGFVVLLLECLPTLHRDFRPQFEMLNFSQSCVGNLTDRPQTP